MPHDSLIKMKHRIFEYVNMNPPQNLNVAMKWYSRLQREH